MLQYAIHNACRYSVAREDLVRLKYLENSLELEVEDHGSGFVAEKLQRGIGLVAMRERAELIGGKLAITPRTQGGTQVRLEIPREKVESHAA